MPLSPSPLQAFSPLRIAVAGFAALAVAMGIGRFSFTPILPMMQDDYAVSIGLGSWLASSNYIGYLLGALAGMLWPMRGRPVLVMSMLAVGLSTFAMGLSSDPRVWLLLRFAAGTASALMFIAVSTRCLSALAEAGRTRLAGLVYAGVGGGIAATGLLCLALMEGGSGSDWAWRICGLFSLLAALFVLPVLGRMALPAATTVTDPGTTFGDGALRLVTCYGIAGFGYIIPATFLPVMAKAVVPDAALFGWSWPVFGVAALVSTLVAAALAQRLGHCRVWMLSHVLMAAGVALPALFGGLAAIILSALLVGGTFVVTTLASLQVAREATRGDATRLVAAMTAAFALGQIIGPLAAGVLFDAGHGFDAVLMLAAVMLAFTVPLLHEPGAGKVA
jgi:MFS family permease